jgi:hypothetical protein
VSRFCHQAEEAAESIAFAALWLREHPPGLVGSPHEERREIVLRALRTLIAEVADQERLNYVLPVDAKTQKHLRRVPGGRGK